MALRTAPPPASVGVVGLGLVGASLCGALRRVLPEVRVVGVARREETARRALADGVCDEASTEATALATAEVVVLCTPVDVMESWMTACAQHAPAAMVTDCGSTKAAVVAAAERTLGRGRFLGGHPMAGRERSGYDAADPTLFSGCTWVVTPRRAADLDAFAPWLAVVAALGAHLEVMEATEHDEAVALVSHLPFVVSAALVDAATASPRWEVASRLASTGFRDMVRLAGGDPAMYAAITASNAAALDGALTAFSAALAALRADLADPERARVGFARARRARADWLDGRAALGRPVP